MQIFLNNRGHFFDQIIANLAIAEFILGLRFKNRFLDLNCDRAADTVTYIIPVIGPAAVIIDAFENAFTEGTEVCPSVWGILTVDKGEEIFSEIGRMAEGELKEVFSVVNDIIEIGSNKVIYPGKR